MRLAAQSKGGYYPTPDRVVDLVADLIHTPTGSNYRNTETLRILDPCCGGGDAVARLAERLDRPNALPIETYGVELHRDRAEEAERLLYRTLAADLFATSIANGAFGALYLNPPYDWDAEDKRVEHAFLTHCTRYLVEGGLLVFIVPRQRLAVSARYLSTHYGRMRCWAFPDPEREVFDQVVLMAYRKADPSPDAYAEGRVREWAEGEPEPLRSYPYPEYSPSARQAATCCSQRAASIRSPPRPRRAAPGCGRARRSPIRSGPRETAAHGRSCPFAGDTWRCWLRRASWTTSFWRATGGACWSRAEPARRWCSSRRRSRRRCTARSSTRPWSPSTSTTG